MPRSAWIQIVILIFVGFATLVSFPRAIDSIEFRVITNPLDISVDRASPAFSALEDSRLTYIEPKQTESSKVVALKANEESYEGRYIELQPMIISSETRFIDPYSVENQKIRIARAYLEKNIDVPTMVEHAEVLVSRALKEKQMEEQAPQKIIVAATDTPEVEEKADEDEQEILNQFLGVVSTDVPQTRTIVASVPKPKAYQPQVFRPLTEDVRDINVPLTGLVKFEGGSAYVQGYDELVLVHEYGNQLINYGSWSEKDSYYRIDVKIPRGHIVAQVYNRNGVLLSEGRIDLSAHNWSADKKTENINIDVFPIQEGLKARVVASASRGLFVRKNMEKAIVEVAGMSALTYDKNEAGFRDGDIIRPSLALLKASLPDFWPSIKLGQAAHTTYINMFSNKSVEALQKIVLGSDSRKDLKENSLVWGRITKDGVPLKGAVVDLAFREDEKVVYYTGPIPDEARFMTTENGEFSIIGNDEGLEVLRVLQIGESILPSFIPTLKGHVSDLELQVLPYRQFEFQSYEAFSGLSLPVAMNIIGEDDILESNDIGFTSIRRRPMQGSTLVEADAGEEFAMTRFSINEKTSLALVPFFKETWLAQFKESPIQTQARAVVGEVQGSDFTIDLIGLPDGVAPQVTYYNPDGSLRTESWGVSDGGYVIKGLPVGLNNVIIQPIGSEKMVTQLAVTDDSAVYFSSTNLVN